MPVHDTAHDCDNGWVHHQHPMKPLGVIMNSTPCPVCNPNGITPAQEVPTYYVINQCDGCRRGLPLDRHGVHHGPGPYDVIGCTKDLYEERQ